MEQLLDDRDPAAVQAFIDAGVDLNAKDERGNTALMWASSKNHPEMVKQLISKGADVNLQNKRSETALMFASKKSNLDIAKILIDAGADVNIQDRDGYTALGRYAFSSEIASLLKEKGSKKNAFLSTIDDRNQSVFMKSLSERERYILASYIANGVPLINGVLQENLDTDPLGIAKVTGTFIQTHGPDKTGKVGVIRQYLTEFLNVVKRAPVLKEELVVYRGTKSKDDLPNGRSFLSTTTREGVTQFYKGKDCCLLKMHLKPGVRIIYIEPLRGEAYDIMKKRRTPPDLWEILVVPPYDAVTVDEGGGNYTVTLTPKEPYVRKAGTRRRRKNKRRKTSKRISS